MIKAFTTVSTVSRELEQVKANWPSFSYFLLISCLCRRKDWQKSRRPISRRKACLIKVFVCVYCVCYSCPCFRFVLLIKLTTKEFLFLSVRNISERLPNIHLLEFSKRRLLNLFKSRLLLPYDHIVPLLLTIWCEFVKNLFISGQIIHFLNFYPFSFIIIIWAIM